MIQNPFDAIASAPNTPASEEIIGTLARRQDIIPMLIEVFSRGSPPQWDAAARVAYAIGYPGNAGVLPWLSTRVAYLVAERLEPPRFDRALVEVVWSMVIPHVNRVLLDKGRTIEDWANAAEDLCDLLVRYAGTEQVAHCGPSVASLLSEDSLPNKPDVRRLMAVLEKLGTLRAPYALPGLLSVVRRSDEEPKVRRKAWRFVAKFDSDALRPYQHVLTDLQREYGDLLVEGM